MLIDEEEDSEKVNRCKDGTIVGKVIGLDWRTEARTHQSPEQNRVLILDRSSSAA